jgi:hypothetical protein
MTRTLPRLSVAVALAGLLISATACVQQSGLPSDCNASSVERTASLTDGGLDPDSFDVCKGQAVTLTITVQVAGTLHLHGYDDQVPEKEVAVGDVAKLAFTASRAGQFPLELHTGTDEIELAILTVHER